MKILFFAITLLIGCGGVENAENVSSKIKSIVLHRVGDAPYLGEKGKVEVKIKHDDGTITYDHPKLEWEYQPSEAWTGPDKRDFTCIPNNLNWLRIIVTLYDDSVIPPDPTGLNLPVIKADLVVPCYPRGQ